jgi:Domain of unknown function (DUF4129)
VIAAGTPSGEARDEARRILSERRYRGSDVPRPLHDALDWLGRRLHFVGRFYDWLAGLVGGYGVVELVAAALVVALAAWVAVRLAARRASRDSALAGVVGGERSLDPRELERLAEEAEVRGDLEIALRLRFRAGLLRLGRAHALELRPSLTTREARRALRNPRFDALARNFDEVVYGRRPPSSDDVAAARTEWPRVLDETSA